MQPSTVALSSSWCCWALRFRYWKACASFTCLASCCPSEALASTPKWTRTAPKWPWGVLPAPSSLPLLPWGASQGFRKCPATENWFFLNQDLKKWISHQEHLMTMEEFTLICSYLPIYSPPDAFLSSPMAVFTPSLCWFDSISLHGTFSSRIAITKSSFFYFQCSHIVIFIWFVHSTSYVCLHIFL